MNQPHTQHTIELEEENSIDIRKWIVKILSIWYVFAICIVIAIAGCYYYNRTINPLFKSTSTVLIEEVKQQTMMGAQSVMQDFGVGSYRNVNNQIVLLSSHSMIKRTVEKLPLNIDYHYEEKFRKYPYYKNAPIEVTFSNKIGIPTDVTLSITDIDKDYYLLNTKGNAYYAPINKKVRYGQSTPIAGNAITITKTGYYVKDEMPIIFFKCRGSEDLIQEFSSRLAIDFVMDEATIVEVSLLGANPNRDIDFLNTLVQEFLNDNLERKNQEAIRTINFISEQLEDVAGSLSTNENSLQDYRSQNNVINITSQTTLLINKANSLDLERSALLTKKDYYNYLIDYFSKDKDNALISPSTIGIEDNAVNRYITQYSEFLFKKQMLAPKDPYHSVIDEKLKRVRTSLVEATKNAIENTNISIVDIEKQISEVKKESELLPSKERKLLGIQRQLAVNDTYFTYLLQKRSEAQIQQASNSPDNTLIDYARNLGRTNQKKSRLNYIIALILGGGLPLFYLIMVELFNTKIQSKEDIEHLTSYPIVGSISHSIYEGSVATISHPKTTLAESFRALRTRLDFMQTNRKSSSIMLTSALSGEGKTFVAMNLAGIFALSGKKTILIGYDLRKPKLTEYTGEETKYGLSNYLAGQKELDDVIKNHDENLDIIYSGTIPPNPGELAANREINETFFSELKKRYDYVIVDSTPIGIVADAFMVGQHVDQVLFIARHNYTHKSIFKDCITQLGENNLSKVAIVANDISIKQSTYRYGQYIYGKNYGNGYSNGYLNSNENTYTQG